MIGTDIAAKVLSRAQQRGADFAELYVEDGQSGNLSMASGKIENSVSSRTLGAGIRVIKGLNYVYVYTNDLSEQGLLKAAEQAAAALPAAQAQQTDLVLHPKAIRQNSPILVPIAGVALPKKAAIVKRAYGAASGYHPLISQVRVNYIDWTKQVLVANTDGLYARDERTYSRLATMAVAADGGETQTGFEGPGAQMGFEFFDTLDIEASAREAARVAVGLLKADLCPSGRMPVILGNGFGGVIFHEACGHPLEAAFVSKGESVFAGKMGTPIASAKVSAVDDATLPNAWGSGNMDDEGNPTRRNLLIENGVLKSYLVDRLSALRMGGASNGAGRRQS
ncbi:MAG: TldD/PmbA family protein, partial [Eubacteriales bacterium]|nr:TldD/PmbA family protein [Eubacteriales bacterium]